MDIRTTINLFMDSKAVTAAVDRSELRFLKRYGALTRTVARRSIRKRKKPAATGQPPSSHGEQLLKKFLFFAYDTVQRSMVIGPAQLSGPIRKLGIPRVLEEGGDSPVGPLSKNTTAYVEKRPYMNPAKAVADQKIPQLLKDSVK